MIVEVVDSKDNDDVSSYVGQKIFSMVREVVEEAQDN